MSLSTKILIAIGAIIALCAASLIIYKQYEISDRQQAIETEIVKQKELSDNITRSLNEFATKQDMAKFATDNKIDLDIIQKDMDKLHAEIKSINVITVISGGTKKDGVPSTGVGPANPNPQTPTADCNGETIPCPNADPNGYLTARRDLTLSEQFGSSAVPIGTVGFSAWKKEPWFVNVLPRQYKVATVTGIDENQREYVYNRFSIIIDGKSYDLRIDKAETKQEYPSASFQFWNPRLFMGIDGGVNITVLRGEFAPSFDVGIMSYGRYKNQPDFSFLQLGIGYGTVSGKLQGVVTPFAYNVGKHLPLMNNMYLGPSLYLGTNGDISIMGGLRTAL